MRGAGRHPPRVPLPSGEAEHHLRAATGTTDPVPKHPRPRQAAGEAGKRPPLTSREALAVLPGDHSAGGRVAGHRAVIPAVHQAMTSLAGVVPATREHMGHQGAEPGTSSMSWPRRASVGASFLVALPLMSDPLGEQQCPHLAGDSTLRAGDLMGTTVTSIVPALLSPSMHQTPSKAQQLGALSTLLGYPGQFRLALLLLREQGPGCCCPQNQLVWM